MQRYFENFPKVTYSNNSIVDITKRVVVLDSVSSNPYAFNPYELDVYERPDQFSTRYYQDPYQSWLIYLANKIVDPYYEWYLSDTELVDYLEKKYGSIYAAQTKIKNYKNSWINVENISVSEYNSLISEMKDYWEPVNSVGDNIIGYSRKQIDWTVNTNKIVNYTPVLFNYSFATNSRGLLDVFTNSLTINISNTSSVTAIQTDLNACKITFSNGYSLSPNSISGPAPSSNTYTLTGEWTTSETAFPIKLSSNYGVDTSRFIEDEIVNIVYSGSTGKGQILHSSNNLISLQHISGVYSQIDGYIFGTESNSNTPFTFVTIAANNLSPEIESYWASVTYYDYEISRNEYNKTIRVLDNRFAGVAVNDLKRLMNET